MLFSSLLLSSLSPLHSSFWICSFLVGFQIAGNLELNRKCLLPLGNYLHMKACLIVNTKDILSVFFDIHYVLVRRRIQ